jgi:diguanylate cyclase (GGDEF)-like protein
MARTARVDPVLLALAVLAAAAITWFAFGAEHARLVMVWPLRVAYDVAFVVLSRRVALLELLGPAPRRFWWALSGAGLLFAVGDAYQAVRMAQAPSAALLDGTPVQWAMILAGVAQIVLTMLLHPGPSRTPAEWMRFWLDCTGFLMAAAVFVWSLASVPGVLDHGHVVSIVTASGLLLVAAFATVKLMLGGNTPISRLAAVPGLLAAALTTIALVLDILDRSPGSTTVGMLLCVGPALVIAAVPRIQELQLRGDPTVMARPYWGQSLIPLTGCATVLIQASMALPRPTLRDLVLVLSIVAVSAVMVSRQALATGDNIAVIKRLDTTLLELRGRERDLQQQATHDPLTGLYNRAGFADEAGQVLADPDNRLGCALLLVDLDDFKTVNDTRGHPFGDALLVGVAARLLRTVRPGDLVARLGGDEFAILARDLAPATADTLAERLLAELGVPLAVDGHTLVVRASVGIAHTLPGAGMDALIRDADIAMYAAKDRGKGTFRRYHEEMGVRIVERAHLATLLEEAIGTDQIRLLYQPIVDLVTGRMTGVEALTRWHHPERGHVSPVEFIPLAEYTGLIVPLGRWILAEACRQAASWRDGYATAGDLVINVNVAGRQLMEPGFVAEVAGVLARTGLPAHQLTVEVTETAVLQGGEVIEVLEQLRDLGVGLALDDFGTAASSLGLLLTCPVSVLKLDRSFVDGLPAGDPADPVDSANRQSAVATAVIQMARALELRAVAEGIETVEQATYLRRLGYRHGQGFLFARPLPVNQVAEWLTGTAAHV